MRTMQCPTCKRSQKTGKFCLDDGTPLEAIVNNDIVFKPIKTKRRADTIKGDVRKWLGRIGVDNRDIKIRSDAGGVEIEYMLANQTYVFKSISQDSVTNNLAAVEMFLHHRVLGIERGIETTEQAFKGYETLEYVSYPDRLLTLNNNDFKKELKMYHPDTGTPDMEKWNQLMVEKQRRSNL